MAYLLNNPLSKMVCFLYNPHMKMNCLTTTLHFSTTIGCLFSRQKRKTQIKDGANGNQH